VLMWSGHYHRGKTKRIGADISMSNQEENHGDGYCSDASVINLEENNGDSGIGCGDGADASCVEKQIERRFQSQSPGDDLENKQSCLDCNCHRMVDLNEQDKAFLRLLGWKEEDEEEEAPTAEEISAFHQTGIYFSKHYINVFFRNWSIQLLSMLFFFLLVFKFIFSIRKY